MRVSTKLLVLLLVSFLALLGLFLVGEWGEGHAISPLTVLITVIVTYAVAGFALSRWWYSASLISGNKSAELAMERRIEERTRALLQQIEDRKRAEHLNRGQKHVLEMLADPGGLTTEEILKALADVVASRDQGWECSIYLVERRGRILTLTASSSVHERMLDYFNAVGKDYPDTPECQAAFSGEMHVVEHLSQFDVPWSQMLVGSGIFSVCSLPFCSTTSGRLTGVLTVYSRGRSAASGAEMEMIESAARLAALVIEHRSIRDQLVRAAYQDPVTELLNRRAGEQALDEAVRIAQSTGQELAVIWVDINRFKHINDHYGPAAGDHVLRTVGLRLKHHPLVTGTVARMGEDEFLVMIPGTPNSIDAVEVARRLSAAIAKPVLLDSTRIDVSAGVGAAVYPQDGTAAKVLSQNSFRAMCHAKATGEGFSVYLPAMSEEANETSKIEEALSVALENNYLRLVYQPIYAADGRLVNFEALLRFKHPELGNIPPARFIPIAEQTRLIVPIGNWVVREACRQLHSWIESGLPSVGLSVNICALQFARDDFSDTVASVIEEYGLDPDLITIELTESVLMGDYSSVVRQMNMLRQCGVHIAMDDFGTGYSSLGYLHRLPVDVLKIDRSFIDKLAEPEGTRHIVEAVISMAQRLGLTVVAEGVETQAQLAILERADCHQYQGFLFARPLERVDMERCLRASRNHRFANPTLDEDDEAATA